MADCLSCQVPYDCYLELSLRPALCFEYLGEDADQWSIGPLACMTKLAFIAVTFLRGIQH